ncbi:Transcriptional regulator, contains XRE-family HTH domain [Paractinoplanes atraurantiacus]|uniref:Transcriptional regulator, contains XRE-family HTH domain n=1 Tax=Paractinoplanes atraurantiacus TaxID=1036182 RepID=A0A285HV64_9ACTN|nr:Transcriptional regulator, contains XRE-family HTH domain [Actinoplanes atraurantiacus]
MVSDDETGRLLAERLRDLRLRGFPGIQVEQSQLAVAFGVSVPLISAWEKQDRPVTPGAEYLAKYARFFASDRSLNDGHPLLPSDDDLTGDERDRRLAIEDDLMDLRAAALGLPIRPADESTNRLRASLGSRPWRFPPDEDITIVCARLPQALLENVPSSDRFDPDFVEAYRYADLDSLIELHGHIRAVNPDNTVRLRVPADLVDDDRSTHLVLLGGVDWNLTTRAIMPRVGVPIRQTSRPTAADRGAFEVAGTDRIFEASWDQAGGLTDDVALFLRAPNPFNRERTVTICNAPDPGRGDQGAGLDGGRDPAVRVAGRADRMSRQSLPGEFAEEALTVGGAAQRRGSSWTFRALRIGSSSPFSRVKAIVRSPPGCLTMTVFVSAVRVPTFACTSWS